MTVGALESKLVSMCSLRAYGITLIIKLEEKKASHAIAHGRRNSSFKSASQPPVAVRYSSRIKMLTQS
jgi:hypothetical protein